MSEQIKLSALTKQERNKLRKLAYRTWALSKMTNYAKSQMLQAAASKTGLTIEQIKKLHKKDNWEEKYLDDIDRGTFKKIIEKQKQKALENIPNKEVVVETIDELLEKSGLNEKHKMFIMYYLNNFNATQAALNCGYTKHSANNTAAVIMNNPKVKKILNRALELMQEDLHLNSKKLLTEYMHIAFADVTDFVEFDGRRVKLKDSTKVDGRLITEVKQGKDGITVKLVDKKWAMDKLEKLLNIIPDRKLLLEQEKFEFTKQLAEKQTEAGNKVVIINDL